MIPDQPVTCEHCDEPVTASLFEVTVAVWHRAGTGFFAPAAPPATVPVRSRLRLCGSCSEKVFAAVDGPWAVDDDGVDEAVAAMTPAAAPV